MQQLEVLVTVGMGPYPFDRLIRALGGTCDRHRVFAQIGTANVIPLCDHARFVDPFDLLERMRRADVVITHGGNTVRLVQRMGKVPIAVARRSEFGEMSNDHQVSYLRAESLLGRVVVIEQLEELDEAVDRHWYIEDAIISSRPPPPSVNGEAIANRLDRLAHDLLAPTYGPLVP